MYLYTTFKQVVEKYGFKARCGDTVESVNYGTINAPVFIIQAKDKDGHWVNWFRIVPDMGLKHKHNSLVIGNDTDVINVWLYETRPDLTPENYVMFFAELNGLFHLYGEDRVLLKDWIDPEDWQEIADVTDAYEDPMYTDPDWRRKQ